MTEYTPHDLPLETFSSAIPLGPMPCNISHGLMVSYDHTIAPAYLKAAAPIAPNSWAINGVQSELDTEATYLDLASWNGIDTSCGTDTGIGLGLHAMLPRMQSTPILTAAGLVGTITPKHPSPDSAYRTGHTSRFSCAPSPCNTALGDYAIAHMEHGLSVNTPPIHDALQRGFQIMPLSPPMSDHTVCYSDPASPMCCTPHIPSSLSQGRMSAPTLGSCIQDMPLVTCLPSTPDHKLDFEKFNAESLFDPPSTMPQTIQDRKDLARRLVARTRQRRRKIGSGVARPQCGTCFKLFSRPFNLKNHMKTHEEDRPKPFACDECPRRFSRKLDCERHMRGSHLRQKNEVCPHCNRGFARKDTQRRHIEGGCLDRMTTRAAGGKKKKSAGEKPLPSRRVDIIPAPLKLAKKDSIVTQAHIRQGYIEHNEDSTGTCSRDWFLGNSDDMTDFVKAERRDSSHMQYD